MEEWPKMIGFIIGLLAGVVIGVIVSALMVVSRRTDERADIWRGPCEAVQHNDSVVCKRCNLCWDVNDYDLPLCKPKV